MPEGPVEVGDRWDLPDELARSLGGYDTIATQTVGATLRAIDEERAEIDLKGRVEGSALGGRGRIDLEGTATFDRKAGRIASLELRRAERREPGPIEAGLEFRSTLRVSRSEAEAEGIPAAKMGETIPDDWLRLAYEGPGDRYRLEHDRSWHVFSEDDRQAVLRRLDGGTVAAQCNLVIGPEVEPGAHPKPDRFRDDVREALGERFDRVIDAGEVSAPSGEYRYRLAIRGKQQATPIVWYYYLISDASGRQLVAIFTLRVGRRAARPRRPADDRRDALGTQGRGRGGRTMIGTTIGRRSGRRGRPMGRAVAMAAALVASAWGAGPALARQVSPAPGGPSQPAPGLGGSRPAPGLEGTIGPGASPPGLNRQAPPPEELGDTLIKYLSCRVLRPTRSSGRRTQHLPGGLRRDARPASRGRRRRPRADPTGRRVVYAARPAQVAGLDREQVLALVREYQQVTLTRDGLPYDDPDGPTGLRRPAALAPTGDGPAPLVLTLARLPPLTQEQLGFVAYQQVYVPELSSLLPPAHIGLGQELDGRPGRRRGAGGQT